jgi:hypothetical protein
MGPLGGDQAHLLDRLAAPADRDGEPLMAIGLDAIRVGVQHQEADFAAGSRGTCHGENWRGTPGPRPAGVGMAGSASHREVRTADTAAWPDPCQSRTGGHAGYGHAIAMADALVTAR